MAHDSVINPSPRPAPEPLAEVAAVRTAHTQGKPVSVPSLTSETSSTVANPDGTLTSTVTAAPTRVRQGGTWKQIDTTLINQGGVIKPRLTLTDVQFSAGGEAPMASMKFGGGKRYEVRWPTLLPAPELRGDTAIYHDVLPGADLEVIALAEGFTHNLVLRKRPTAPLELKFAVVSPGLRLSKDAQGNIELRDLGGELVAAVPAPMMWDSTKTGVSRGSQASRLPGKYQARVATEVVSHGDRADLVLRPDPVFLANRDITYPVVVDPTASLPSQVDTYVMSWNSGAGYNKQALFAGRTAYWDNASQSDVEVLQRSYVRFDLAQLVGKRISDAVLQLDLNNASSRDLGSSGLQARRVTGSWSESTLTWSKQPTSTTEGAATGRGWPVWAGGTDQFVTLSLTGMAQKWADGTANNGIVLQNAVDPGPGVRQNWIFCSMECSQSSSSLYPPTLVVTYNAPPATPSSLGTSPSVPCVDIPYELPTMTTTTPTLKATISDPDANNVSARFEWWNTVNNSMVGFKETTLAVQGLHSAQIPSGAFADGTTVSWRVQAKDSVGEVGSWSPWCSFVLDTQPPAKPPLVTSTDFPENQSGSPVGQNGSFTFAANGQSKVLAYAWAVDNPDPQQRVDAATPGSSVTVSYTPTAEGAHTLSVVAIDKAGRRSPRADYRFQAARANPLPLVNLSFDDGDGTVALDSSSNHNNATLKGGATWSVEGKVGGYGLALDGGNGSSAETERTVLRTDASYTVGTWVKLTDATRSVTAVSQDGAQTSGFVLGFDAAANRWKFTPTPATGTAIGVPSTSAPQTGVWTHLAGVFDAAAGKARLYVNGVLQGDTAFTAPIVTNGAMAIGRNQSTGSPGQFWQGDLDEVIAYQRVLSDQEISQMSAG
ncbi:LamG-like jellyroll fold domain-containing protein [Nonomuraea sp. NPDC050556]|uniref:LamG-like jellyroll fold domain-containing protein n=1 Tax=Nonomuraea sp. NPDC050556 TaxID=3364369 RepID=UPI00379157C0